MKLLIALYHSFSLWNPPAWLLPRMRRDFPDHTIEQLAGPRYAGIETAIAEADAAIAWSLRPEQFAHAKKLRWIHSPAAAVHQLMFPELQKSNVVVTNAREIHGPVVAEHALAVLLALARRLPTAVRQQGERRWAQSLMWEEHPRVREAAGATVIVFGLGSIGREFAGRAKAMGMRVIGVREHPDRGFDGCDEVIGPAQFQPRIHEADYVVLCAPLTPQTKHVINDAVIAAMKPDGCLINVARGPLIDDGALVAALRERRIGGAALDVFAEEPLPQTSQYWTLDNVLITPHTAALTDKLWERQYGLIRENFRLFIAGEPLLAVVDKSRGY